MIPNERLNDIEDLAEDDLDAAIRDLRALGAEHPEDARACRLLAALIARTGAYADALHCLDASPDAKPEGQLESQVLRASILAADGQVMAGVKLLGDTVTALRAHGGLPELLADAEEELESYRSLLSHGG